MAVGWRGFLAGVCGGCLVELEGGLVEAAYSLLSQVLQLDPSVVQVLQELERLGVVRVWELVGILKDVLRSTSKELCEKPMRARPQSRGSHLLLHQLRYRREVGWFQWLERVHLQRLQGLREGELHQRGP